jgi:hypothetical protein
MIETESAFDGVGLDERLLMDYVEQREREAQARDEAVTKRFLASDDRTKRS